MQVTEWSTGGSSPAGLSVASTLNVLVSCCDSPLLRMYTPLGCPVCEISVQRPGLVGLVHGLQLDSGWFVVIGVTEAGDRQACVHRNDHDLPDLLDSSGSPAYLAMVGGDDGSYVWLAERCTGAGVRMLQVPATSCSAKLPAVELEDPEKMCWNENSQRLYIVQNGRVKICRVHM